MNRVIVPVPVRAAAAHGRQLRSRHGRGGTRVACMVADALCGDGPDVGAELLRLIVDWHADHPPPPEHGGLPGAESNAWIRWHLMGGPHAAAWASRLLAPASIDEPPAALTAAVDDRSDRLTRRLAAADIRADARLEELLRTAIAQMTAAAIGETVTTIEPRSRRNRRGPEPAPLAAALDTIDRSGLADQLRHVTSLDQVAALVPGPVLAAVSATVEDRLAASADHFTGQVEAVLADAQGDASTALAGIGAPPGTVGDPDDRSAAAAFFAAAATGWMLGRLGARSTAADTGGPIPDGTDPATRAAIEAAAVMPWSILRDTVAVSAGAATDGTSIIRDGIGRAITADGRAFDATGPASIRVVPDTASTPGVPVIIEGNVWNWGGATHPFDPHLDLDGVTWRTELERAERLAADPGVFPYVAVYYPGDHTGCSCSIGATFEVADPGEESFGI